MFDWYRPARLASCPSCGAPLATWQGKDGPCRLFVYAEGASAPVEHAVDEELRVTAAALAAAVLPASVVIYSYDCPRHPIEALAVVRDGRWCETVVLTPASEPA